MKLCIVAGHSGDDVKPMLIREARKIFDSVNYASLDRIRIEFGGKGKSKVYYKNNSLESFDAVWVRAFGEDFILGQVLLGALEENNVFLLNSIDGLQACHHKFMSLQFASDLGINVPDSYFSISPAIAQKNAKKIGYPQVVKLLSGFGGKGVMLASSEKEFIPLFETIRLFSEFIIGQKFIESNASDYRALVIGNEIIGIRRTAGKGDWRANVSSGGNAELIELPPEVAASARAYARLIGMPICSVDFLKSGEKFIFVESNFAPGMLEKIFKNRLAKTFLRKIKKIMQEKRKMETE